MDIIKYLSEIEDSIPNREYPYYYPSGNFDANDIISVQKEAKKMVTHVGLHDCIPIVTFVKTAENEGGHIELDSRYSKEVFIEIDEESLGFRDIILCTMAHEICHKVLHNCGFKKNITDINEKCTDLATVVVGFGKLSLNGCHVMVSRNRYKTTGYLTKEQFTLALYLVSKSRKISQKEMKIGLNFNASDELELAISKYESEYHFETTFDEKFGFSYESDSILTRETIVAEKIISILKEKYQEEQQTIQRTSKNLRFRKDGSLANPLFSLYSLHLLNSSNSINKHNELHKDKDVLAQSIALLASRLSEEEKKDSINEILLHIQCPCCGYKSTNKVEEQIKKYKCPKCKHTFLWDSRRYEMKTSDDFVHKTKKSEKMARKRTEIEALRNSKLPMEVIIFIVLLLMTVAFLITLIIVA